MKTYFLKSAFILTLALLTTTVYATQANINNAWIAEAPPVSKVMAAYMVIKNPGTEALQILDAESTDFGKIEFHRTVHENGMARMNRQPSLVVPANGELTLEPGGYHMMLFRPARTLRAGDTSKLNFTLKNGEKMQVEAVVKKAAMEESHEHHHHH